MRGGGEARAREEGAGRGGRTAGSHPMTTDGKVAAKTSALCSNSAKGELVLEHSALAATRPAREEIQWVCRDPIYVARARVGGRWLVMDEWIPHVRGTHINQNGPRRARGDHQYSGEMRGAAQREGPALAAQRHLAAMGSGIAAQGRPPLAAIAQHARRPPAEGWEYDRVSALTWHKKQ